jgi:hypothetical protein
MSKTQLYAIVDAYDRFIGTSLGKVHLVHLFDTKKEAKQYAISSGITDYRVVIAEYAINLNPSKLSR